MLGKTNVTAIEGGTIVTDIEKYNWKLIKIDGLASDFVRAVYGRDILVAITKDGTIAYTRDGENWEKVRLDLEGDYELTDIIWNGSGFVMVGNQREIVEYHFGDQFQHYSYHGIVATTENLIDFTIEQDGYNEYSRYYAIIEKDGMRIIISKQHKIGYGDPGIFSVITNSSGMVKKRIAECGLINTSAEEKIRTSYSLNKYEVIVAKKISGGAVYIKDNYKGASSGNVTYINLTSDWIEYASTYVTIGNTESGRSLSSMFECKDNIYVYSRELNHLFYKIVGGSERILICTGTAFFFIDAVYFNKCELFFNEHSMVVVREGENIANKSLDDLIDITYDFGIKFVEKAFDGLYIFCTDGNVLVSSDEIKDEGAVAVKTLSASKALYDAKAYADEKFAMLEARIIALENRD